MRKKMNFNSNWYFHMGELEQKVEKITSKTGTCGGASNLTREEGFVYKNPQHIADVIGIEDGNSLYSIAEHVEGIWDMVDLPHDWKIRQDYVKPSSYSGMLDKEGQKGYLPDGVGYYRKKFSLPKEDLGKRIVIEFEGVMRDAIVWVNGCYIGSHLSGYTGFAYDISAYLNYGDEGENVILVKTDCTYEEGWWAEGAGIYRDVWLYQLDPVHVKRHGTFVYCKDITDSNTKVMIDTEIENKLHSDCSVTVRKSLVSQEDQILYHQEKELTVGSLCVGTISFDFMLENPILWDLDHPYLYKMVTEIVRENEIVDHNETLFGVRDIKYTSQGLLLNGKWIEIKGVCEHQDFAGVGTALTPDIIDYKLTRIKEMGGNAYRSAHHPATDYLLQACDRMGILVLNENRRLDVGPEGLNDVEELIKGSRNHPSVFMWCMENEEFITLLPPGKRLLNELMAYAKKLDPTRLFTVAGQFAKGDSEYESIPDVVGFNYDSGHAKARLENYPGSLVMASEDASFVSTRGVYEDNRELGVCDSYDSGSYYEKVLKGSDVEISSGTVGGASSLFNLVYCWNHYKHEVPGLGGIFIWTAFDYRGETFPWNWPTINSQYGAMDMCGFEKDVYYYWQSVWMDQPMVHMLPHWNWKGKEGQKVHIDVYSNCDEVELFINNESQGRKKHTIGLITRWEPLYVPGEVKVVAYNDGKPVTEDYKVTTGEPFAIRLSKIYSGKDNDLFKAEIVDKSGLLCPTADNHIQFSVINAEIVGVGNGNPSSHEPDVADQRKAFNGLALVILRKRSENITVMADSDGLESARISYANGSFIYI
ncbi:glycoside hydrolase family 2 TIM barrel-domain containing protein [Paenibacillus sp. GCM10027629]|uniref:glycoside hydrolase family 2 TIM barrel-domain containing protein n=1 Tax=Paenibacillus sp. GCM10027629 TaxID=3273414 RepID=UPI003630BC86